MSEQNDVLARYAELRARLDQPVTVTALIAPAFRAVYDFAAANRKSLAQANALWQEHGLRVQLDEARRERDKHGERARLAEEVADYLRQQLAQAQHDSERYREALATITHGISPEERKPALEQPVLLLVEHNGKRRTLRAAYTPPLTTEVSASGYEGDDAIYDEEKDAYYLPAGWYEWNENEDTHWYVDGKPLAWLPLPKIVPPGEVQP